MKAQNFFSKQNIFWLGIFMVFLAFLSLLFIIMSTSRTRSRISTKKPLIINEVDVDNISEDENIFTALDIRNVHTQYQDSYLEIINKINNTDSLKKTKDGSISINLRDSTLLFEDYRKAQENYNKVLKKIEDHEKDYKIKCFARMRKLILAVLYADKKLGKRITKFDTDKLMEIGALDSIPVCPRGGDYSIIYKNGRRLFNCSIHGILKN